MSLRIRENAINSPFPNEWPKSRPLPETSRKYNRPKRCTFFELEGELYPMEPILIGGLMELYQNLSMDGFRVLAVAYKDLKTREAFSKDDESELILKGYVAFLDPQYSRRCREQRSLFSGRPGTDHSDFIVHISHLSWLLGLVPEYRLRSRSDTPSIGKGLPSVVARAVRSWRI